MCQYLWCRSNRLHNENLRDNLICTTYDIPLSFNGIILCHDKDMLFKGIDILSQKTISENVFAKDYFNPSVISCSKDKMSRVKLSRGRRKSNTALQNIKKLNKLLFLGAKHEENTYRDQRVVFIPKLCKLTILQHCASRCLTMHLTYHHAFKAIFTYQKNKRSFFVEYYSTTAKIRPIARSMRSFSQISQYLWLRSCNFVSEL